MSKFAFFGHISPNFFDNLHFRNPANFLGTPKIFNPPKNISASPNFSYPFRPENSFFRLYRPKKSFLDLKIFFGLFRPKSPFLDLKILSNLLNSLQNHLFNLQSDEKNYILNFSIHSKKNHPSDNIIKTLIL